MRSILVVVALAVVMPDIAGGQKKEKQCDPVPEEFLTAGETFRDCAVDKKARVTRYPKIDYTALPTTGASGCMMAEIDLVVDETGKVVPGSARLVGTNERRYADLLMTVVYETRYEPAKKDGREVKQLDRLKGKAQYRTVSSAVPGSSSRRPPPC
jgi:hypothetical protein